MKTFLFVCFLSSCIASKFSTEEHEEWFKFKAEHDKRYEDDGEDTRRMEEYFKKKQEVESHNEAYRRGLVSFFLEMNRFSDVFADEIPSLGGVEVVRDLGAEVFEVTGESVPDALDWRQQGAVTPVKDQQHCSACWAFSATGALESHHFIKSNNLVVLSEQNLIDCSSSFGNMGCQGGLMDYAFNYIKDSGGLDTQEAYPYEAKDGDCKFDKGKVGATLTEYKKVTSGDENALKEAVATQGPVSVTVDSRQISFQLYSGGIYDEGNCSRAVLDRGLLVVGYGSESGKDFWIVKNSWGESWGEKGYIRMVRNKNNQCGIAAQASFPVL